MKIKHIPFAAVVALSPFAANAQDAMAETAGAAPQEAAIRIDTSDANYVPFKCPIEEIRNAYQKLVDGDDTLVALAIEKQTLSICRQSQEALIAIAENETELRELFEPIMAPPAPVPAPAPAPVVLEVEPEEKEEEVFVPAPPPFTPPEYQIGAVMKDALGWKVMVIDGSAIYTLREGDKMDDGNRVTSISRGKIEMISPDGNAFTLE